MRVLPTDRAHLSGELARLWAGGCLLLALLLWGLSSRGLHRAGHEGDDMLVKILGVLCAGIFVGATLLEARQLRKDRRGLEPDPEKTATKKSDEQGEAAEEVTGG